MEFSIAFEGIGWARLKLTQGQHVVMHGFSYVVDSPRLLLNSVATLLENGSTSVCVWDTEPAIYTWSFEQSRGHLNLTIACNDEGNSEAETQPQFECTFYVSMLEFAECIINGYRAVLSEIGLSLYEQQWYLYPFPMQELLRVESLMVSRRIITAE